MKPAKTKAQIRHEIQNQIDQFLTEGGSVAEIERGISGREIGQNFSQPFSSNGQQQSRTPLTEQVKAIDERRSNRNKPPLLKPKRAKKILLKDDFGEPIRWVWQE